MSFDSKGNYFAPAPRFTVCRPAPDYISKANRTFSRGCTGAGDNKGRTNGMPWDGTSPCTVGTDPMNRDHDAAQLARLAAYLHVTGDSPQEFRR